MTHQHRLFICKDRYIYTNQSHAHDFNYFCIHACKCTLETNTHSCASVTMRDKTGPWLYDSALTLYSELVAKSVLAEMNKKAKII